jgi:hypothetical protein
MKFEKTRISYQLDLTKELDVTVVERIDDVINVALVSVLEKIDGVSSVEYNGHFGNYIFLNLDIDENNAKTKKIITKSIEEHFIGYREDTEKGMWYIDFEPIVAKNPQEAINEFTKNINKELQWLEEDEQEFAVCVSGGRSHDVYKYKIAGDNIHISYFNTI